MCNIIMINQETIIPLHSKRTILVYVFFNTLVIPVVNMLLSDQITWNLPTCRDSTCELISPCN